MSLPENRAILRYVEKYGRAGQPAGDNIIRRLPFGGWITKATVPHSEYVVLFILARQQWIRERASILRIYLYCLSC